VYFIFQGLQDSKEQSKNSILKAMCVKKIKNKLCCATREAIAISDVTMKIANKTDHITCVKQHQSFL